MKRIYVAVVRALRSALRVTGMLSLLDRWARRSRSGAWVRSLLSIYDPAELLTLDVPWWTFKSADIVESFLKETPDARVFEWGSGASSVWIGKRAGSVLSVEHDPEWGTLVGPMLLRNGTLQIVPPTPVDGAGGVRSAKPGFDGLDFRAYVDAIDDAEGNFDLIVVDGRAREACFAKALHRLNPGGMIVFDNVDRERYVKAIEAADARVEVTWTRGLTPSLPYPTRTAVVRLA